MITCASDPIRFAKRFFALREMGVTVTLREMGVIDVVFMISMCFVCV